MNHRQSLFAIALLGLIAASAQCEPPADPPHWVAYRVEAIISKTTPDGKQQVISRPTVMTIERQAATIQVGQRTPITIDGHEVAKVETGITCRFTPFRLKAGGVKLDVEIEIVAESDDMDKTIITEKFGIRRIQQVPLGVRVEVPIVAGRKKASHQLQLTVTEVAPEVAEVEEVPPPPRTATRIRHSIESPQTLER